MKFKQKSVKCSFCFKQTPCSIRKYFNWFCSEACLAKFKRLKREAPYVGQHLLSRRAGFAHHGIGDNEGNVIHYSGFAEGLDSGPVISATPQEFSGGKGFNVVRHRKRNYSISTSIQRAESRLGEASYHLSSNNCEHFVNWCIEGESLSRQVDTVSFFVVMMVMFSAVVTGLSIFSIVGSSEFITHLTGFLFPDIKDASITVKILAFIGLSSGIVMAVIMRYTIQKDSIKLPKIERKARLTGYLAALFTAG